MKCGSLFLMRRASKGTPDLEQKKSAQNQFTTINESQLLSQVIRTIELHHCSDLQHITCHCVKAEVTQGAWPSWPHFCLSPNFTGERAGMMLHYQHS